MYFTKIYISQVYCVDNNNLKINCPNAFTIGDRIAIGSGENIQYFRYLRTTSNSSMLNECGTTSSNACNDNTNGIYRFLAEKSLKRTGDPSSNNAILHEALQDSNDNISNNSIKFGENNSDFNQSYPKIYLNNYAIQLN